MLDGLGVTSPFAQLVARATGVPVARRAGWIDKIALADELRTLGICVPDQCGADELSTTAAVERFGLPLVLKRRTGTGGAEVRIVHDADHIDEMLRSLGGPFEHLFYQRYIDGDLVGYGAVRSRSGPLQEFTAREHKGRTNPLGPTVNVHTIDDERVAAQGRFVLAQLDCGPLAAIEFLEDCDGTLWFIDLSTRAWGNFLSFIGAGLDFPSGYLRVLRGDGPSPARTRPEPGMQLRVMPAAAEDELRASPAHALLALVRDMRPYRRRLGLRYCVVIALGVLAREHSRRSH
jgi:predicted ATP-grasp superfamily ATP-dependent carboligase